MVVEAMYLTSISCPTTVRSARTYFTVRIGFIKWKIHREKMIDKAYSKYLKTTIYHAKINYISL